MNGAQLGLPVAEVGPVGLDAANDLLTAWGHYLGACRRPFGSDAWMMTVVGTPVAVAIGSSIVSKHVRTDDGEKLDRLSVVELARLCSDPSERWATRVMLRIWREVCAQRWPYWPVSAAVAYSQTARHEGDVYRFDGWTRAGDGRGSSGGGAWTRPRYAGDAALGKKRLWIWRYE